MRAADLVQTTSAAVRSLITSGRLPPGAPISERVVATRLGISRGTARGALRLLSQEGFVRASSPGRYSRFRVAPLTAADLTDLTILMAAIDSAGARLAAGLEPVARARLVAVDSRPAAMEEAGDLVAAIEEGLVAEQDLVEIGTIGRDWADGRDPDAITAFKSVGLAIQDVTAAELIVGRLLEPEQDGH